MAFASKHRIATILLLILLTLVLIFKPADIQFAPAFPDMAGRYVSENTRLSDSDIEGLPLRTCQNKDRIDHLNARCMVRKNKTGSAFLTTTDPGFYWRLLVDDKHRSLYCVIPKAACTTWKTSVANMTGVHLNWKNPAVFNVHSEKHLKEVGLQYLYHYNTDEIDFRLRNYFKYMIVRHPLDRIQSAYVDKVIEDGGRYYSGIYDHVIENYRRTTKEKAEAGGGKISLEEFVTYVAHEYPEKRDRHYMSFDDLCHPCDIKYDYVAKVETLSTDTQNLFDNLLGPAETNIQVQPLNSNRKLTSDRLKVLSQFRNVPSEVMKLYYDKFSLDFDLFGYNFGMNGEVVCESGENACC